MGNIKLDFEKPIIELQEKMKELGSKEVNKHQIYIKFTCTPTDSV